MYLRAMSSLKLDGFTLNDLYAPAGLSRLHTRFRQTLRDADGALADTFSAYGTAVNAGKPHGLTAAQESELLINVAHHLSRFVVKLFGLETETRALAASLTGELKLFEFKREFVTRRVFKKGATDRPSRDELPRLDATMGLLLQLGFSRSLPPAEHADPRDDHERALAECVLKLMHTERQLTGQLVPANPALIGEFAALCSRLLSTPEGTQTFGAWLVGEDPLPKVRNLLNVMDRWTWARASFSHTFHGWSTLVQPKPLVFDKLVELKYPDASLPEVMEGPDQHLRRRDGFKLTDRRATERQAMGEVDYCVICHEREKDSCSKGFKE